jgi:hypothetical protein
VKGADEGYASCISGATRRGDARIKVQNAKLRKSPACGGLRNSDIRSLMFDFGQGAVGIWWERLSGVGEGFQPTLCHVESANGGSRHLAADRMCLSFAAGSLRSGLRPPVEKTSRNNESQSATECRPHPSDIRPGIFLDRMGWMWYKSLWIRLAVFRLWEDCYC